MNVVDRREEMVLNLQIETAAKVKRKKRVRRVVVRTEDLVGAPIDDAALVSYTLGFVLLERVQNLFLMFYTLINLVTYGKLK